MQNTLTPGLWPRFKGAFLGDRQFYRTVLAIILPIIVQHTVSNFVSLLDNVMVGAVGTLHMSGVAISNQLLFVFNLAVFGAVSGAGIYGAQFVGARDWEGFRQTFRFKLIVALVITVLFGAILLGWPDTLISLYLTGEGSAADAAAMLHYGRQYLHVMLWGLIPFALAQVYSSSLRETGETLLPMTASIAAVAVNVIFNYFLIFGKCGFPELGVTGAAIATVFSRFVELGVVLVFSHANHKKFFFMKGVYRTLRIGKALAADIAAKSMPLLLNELLWSMGMSTLTAIFSTCGLMVVAGLNIATTITNLFNVFHLSVGMAVAIMIGQALGANDIALARKQVWKLIFFGACISIAIGGILALCADAIPRIYNADEDVRRLAAVFIRTGAMYMVFNAIAHGCYFAIRSGGKIFMTMLFDSIYTWVFCVPYTYLMVRYSGLNIEVLYPLCYLTEVVKCFSGLLVVRLGYWARNMVSVQE